MFFRDRYFFDDNYDMNLPSTIVELYFTMTMLNGSSLYPYSIRNFTLSNILMANDNNYVIIRSVTIIMKDKPINDVPINIRS